MDKLKQGYRFLSYKLERCIGKGAFGAVYSAQQDGTGNIVAIKFEFPNVQKSILLEESEITKAVSSSESFPNYFGSGREQGFTYLVIEMLGMSLRSFQDNHTGGILPLNEVGALGASMLKAIRDFHNLGFVHRDIKPSNFVFRGRPDQSKLCLIDFGLAKRWRSAEGEVFKPRPNVGFRGTSRYASINSHDGADLGRRDDLWSLFYCIVELVAPPLPWKTQVDKDAVAQLKRRSNKRLCTGLPPQFLEFADHLSTLGFADEPDYEMLLSLCKSIEELGGVEGGSEFGVCLTEQYSSMALIVSPNSGSVIGSSSAVEGSWSSQPVIAPPPGKGHDNSESVTQTSGGCCNIM